MVKHSICSKTSSQSRIFFSNEQLLAEQNTALFQSSRVSVVILLVGLARYHIASLSATSRQSRPSVLLGHRVYIERLPELFQSSFLFQVPLKTQLMGLPSKWPGTACLIVVYVPSEPQRGPQGMSNKRYNSLSANQIHHLRTHCNFSFPNIYY